MYVVDSSIFASIVVKDEFYERVRRFLTWLSGCKLIAIGIAFVEVANTLWKHDYVLKTIPMGRIAETNDVVGAALFLASGMSDFVTGEVVTVDGGSMA